MRWQLPLQVIAHNMRGGSVIVDTRVHVTLPGGARLSVFAFSFPETD